jgi:predicted transcriptional regulator
MPPTDGLSEIQEAILLVVWKLKGVGSNRVDEIRIKGELSNVTSDDLKSAFGTLQALGFLEAQAQGEESTFSLTPLGVAILRKTEEDRLQELK